MGREYRLPSDSGWTAPSILPDVIYGTGLVLAELGHVATMMLDSGPIWREDVVEPAPVVAVVGAPSVQTVFVLKSFKYRDGIRRRYAAQWEDHELSTELAQKAIRIGVATTTSDDRRKQLRGTRSGAIDVNAIDIVDLDAAELPAGEKYLGPDPVLVAADFRTLPSRPDRLFQVSRPVV
jgi:hypothetical protein